VIKGQERQLHRTIVIAGHYRIITSGEETNGRREQRTTGVETTVKKDRTTVAIVGIMLEMGVVEADSEVVMVDSEAIILTMIVVAESS